MKVYNNLTDNIDKNTVATVGFFDGVHVGHKKILNALKIKAQKTNSKTTVITLWPHARYVLNIDAKKLKLLNTLKEKISLLEQQEIDNLIILNFTKEFAKLNSEEFISNILIDKLSISELIVGYNHKFGSDGTLDNSILHKIAIKYNIKITKEDEYLPKSGKISSSIIRNMLQNGEIEQANRMLDYNYFFTGKVIHGNKIGNTIGFPTANIKLTDTNKLCPKSGIYATKVIIDKILYHGMLYIGNRPTIPALNSGKRIEVNILDFNEDIYGKELSIIFEKKLRNDKKYDNISLLKEQLIKDRIETVKYFSKK